ncbi:polysulfide reductase NrfD [Candidatus Bathyarchaeota archaeon]|nr:polysulfide reductase NrfD [Candidatus Bathyarchaeota archaeon]
MIEEFLSMFSFGANWGVLVALELFLAGLGAGAYIVGSSIDLFGEKSWRRLAFAGALMSWPMVGVGLGILIIDLGRPELNTPSHLMNVFNNLSSMMTIGSTLLTMFLAISLLTTVFWVFKWHESLLRSIIEIAGISLGFGVALYPGLLLAFARGRVFWASPFLPWLFLVSAICTGLALVGLAETWLGRILFPFFSTGTEDAMIELSRTLRFGILAKLLILTLYVISVWQTKEVLTVLMGRLAPFFWAAVAGGLLIPFAIEEYGERVLKETGLRPIIYSRISATISFILVLLGGILLRYAILIGGQI